ncbi:MAG: ferric enterobactin receptor [Rhodothermales bacterium]|jgi:ferric enterobactin receptor
MRPLFYRRSFGFLVLLLTLGLTESASARQAVTVVSGSVVDAKTGETLPYATVRIDSLQIGAASNIDGYFALLGVPVGRHTLTISYIGFRPTLLAIDTRVEPGPYAVRLDPSSTELDEVLVVADHYEMMRTAESISQITLSPKDLAALPSIGEVDIFRSLQLLPGISGTNEGSSGLYVRGGTPDQNLVLLDGMTVYNVDHFFGFFSAFNADAIKDVQVYKGGFPAVYGGRTSSVVDLTGKGGADEFQAGFGVNLLSASSVIEAPLGEKASFLLSARRSYTDILRTGLYNSIYESLTGEDITPEAAAGGRPGGGGPGGGRGGAFGAAFTGPGQVVVQPDFYFYDLNGKLTYRPTSTDVIAMSLYNGQDNLDESRFVSNEVNAGGAGGATIVNDIYDVTGWGNLGVSGKWSRLWTPTFFSNAIVAYSEYYSESTRNSLNERYAVGADTATFSRALGSLEDNALSDFTVRLDNELQLNQAHKLAFGGQFTSTETQYEFTRNDTLSILNSQAQSNLSALFLQDTWKPNSRLSLTVGLRAVYYDLTEETFLEPRASMRLDVTDRLQIKAGFGHYNQFIARVVNENVTEGARDFWLVADGESVGVQSSTHYVLGAAYETPSWLFDIEAYHKDLTGLSEFTLRFQRTEADFEASNLFYGGTGVARGIDMLVQKKFGRTTGWIAYTLASVEHTFPGLNGGEAFSALHDQRHELKLVQSTRIGRRWTASATWTLATGKPFTSPESEYAITLLDGTEQSYIHVGDKNSERLPAYHRMDASVHYRFPVKASTMDIGFSVFNLYNRKNVWYREFDLSQTPLVTTDVSFLGVTPNLSVRVDF